MNEMIMYMNGEEIICFDSYSFEDEDIDEIRQENETRMAELLKAIKSKNRA